MEREQATEQRRTGERYWSLERIVELVKQAKEHGGTLVQVNEVRIELAPPTPLGFVPIQAESGESMEQIIQRGKDRLRALGALPNLADQLEKQQEQPDEDVDADRFAAG